MDAAQNKATSGTISIRNVRTTEALARFAGNQERYRHWLIEFISYGAAAVAQIRQAIIEDSRDTAISLTHGLKGRSGMLGIVELQSIALSLEMALRNSEPTTLLLEDLERACAETGKEISAVFDKPAA